MALSDFPLPAELAVDEPPLSDEDLAVYFGRLDEQPDPDYAPLPASESTVGRWRVEADDQAEWALRKLALANEEMRRLAEQAQEWERRIRAWFQQAAATHERTAAFMEDRLADYALRLRAAGGPATLQLPSGTIKTTEQKPAVEVADDALLARILDEALGEPQRALDEDELARWRAWQEAWAKATAGMEEPLELVKRTPKVYVGPLRKLVHVEERPTGRERLTLTLACDHEAAEVIAAGAETDALLGSLTACPLCPADSIDGEAMQVVVATQVEPLTELVPVGPDGDPVPGAQVRPGGITPKVEAR